MNWLEDIKIYKLLRIGGESSKSLTVGDFERNIPTFMHRGLHVCIYFEILKSRGRVNC
jgi:hypothetical protein